MADSAPVRSTGRGLVVKVSASAPINGPMRAPRIAPLVALGLALVAAGVAVPASRVADWRAPAVLVVLFVFAVVADRVEITTRNGASLVGSLPVFVLAASLFRPAPPAPGPNRAAPHHPP